MGTRSSGGPAQSRPALPPPTRQRPPLLARQVFHLIVPFRQQALALGRGAVFGKVVVDKLDLREIGRARRRLGLLVGGLLIGFRLAAEDLRLSGQRPVVPFFRVVEGPRPSG